MANYVMVSTAAKQSTYSARHIRYLVQQKLVDGYKEGIFTFVNLEELKQYEVKMSELGKKKHAPKRKK